MEDGRRVFKNEDGTTVFDEHWQEMDADDLDSGLVGQQHATWETFEAEKVREDELTEERHRIIECQERVDAFSRSSAPAQIGQHFASQEIIHSQDNSLALVVLHASIFVNARDEEHINKG